MGARHELLHAHTRVLGGDGLRARCAGAHCVVDVVVEGPVIRKERKPRRRDDMWVSRLRMVKELLIIISALVMAILSAYIGQKSNDPANENKASMQRIEDAQRLRSENERLKAEIERREAKTGQEELLKAHRERR
jgi:hypothetical protein